MKKPRVLFVSKAIAPPFRDGSCCIVRELAVAMDGHALPTVLTTEHAPAPASHVRVHRIYRNPRRYAPALRDNMRVLTHVATDFQHDLWHFVFAPNPRAASAATWLRRFRKLPVVQTVASRPRSFEDAKKWLFGDQIVAVSQHTADKLLQNGVPSRQLSVMPVPISDLSKSSEQQKNARKNLGIAPEVPLFVYAGDLEFSHGAAWMAQATPAILSALDDAVVVFACRAKTARAAEHQRTLEKQLAAFQPRVRFVGEVNDLPALVASSTALPFVVDDLYGKVDLPYVVLEAALLQVPVLVCEGGPLDELAHVPRARAADTAHIARFCVEMARDNAARIQLGEALRNYVLHKHDPTIVALQMTQLYNSLL